MRVATGALLAILSVSLAAQDVSFDRIMRAEREPQNWLSYSGTIFNQRYSQLAQITPANVKNLDLTLPPSVDVSPGTVFLPCAGDTSVPAKVTFRPVLGADLETIPGLGSILEDVQYQASLQKDVADVKRLAIDIDHDR